MTTAEDKTRLVAYCGLYCGNCGAYKRGRCRACLMGGGFSSCKVRECCIEKDYKNCAGCDEYLECRILNSFIARIFGFIFRTDRKANLQGLKEMGIEKWAEEMAASGKK